MNDRFFAGVLAQQLLEVGSDVSWGCHIAAMSVDNWQSSHKVPKTRGADFLYRPWENYSSRSLESGFWTLPWRHGLVSQCLIPWIAFIWVAT